MTSSPARRAAAERMTVEAVAFLDSLTADQRGVAQWPFPADDERRLWFYTPTDHGGLTLHEMTPPQQRGAHRLLASGLSRAGYVTAATIISLDNILDHVEGWVIEFGRPRGRDPMMYYVRVFGDPAGNEPWGWRVGGHHLSVHYTIIDGVLEAVTPCFMGADPASAPLLGPHPLRPLAGVEDVARALVQSLDVEQRPKVIVARRAPTDLVGGNRSSISEGDDPLPLYDIWRGRFSGEVGEFMREAQDRMDERAKLAAADVAACRWSATPKGMAASALRAEQREMLDALLRLYVGRLPDDVADEELAKFSGAGLDDLHVMWAGGTEPGQPHYYRVHGPTLLLEYDNTARDANHVHSVWRDPRGDFGHDALARHYAHEH